ncbi:KAP family P-loop domain-containing protein [Paenibacillus polysaccharolyticus]|uniref:KAP family P-loop domain-containing protein n=1 Tax=Paenibacillus polysaccharolyticus TaxID=582692 RepID=A0A1G5AS06_9BACL|nr:P-loop NTPase fold protein [Paenibacillus polysaccharolyticus]SCX80665.1 KAP family P-loop domain-containing protein [Paenibacillus polysaccharolyticus]
MSRDEEKRIINVELYNVREEIDDLVQQLHGAIDEEHYEEPIQEEGSTAHLNELSRKAENLKSKLRIIEVQEENENKISNFSSKLELEAALIDKESDVDLLDRNAKANALARLIANKQTIAPLTIGIYGKWGRGKSTFAGLIEKNLDKINQKIKQNDPIDRERYKKSYIVRFNPTEYDDHKMIWFSILKELYLKYDAETKLRGRIKFAWNSLVPSFRSNKAMYLFSGLLVISCILAYSLWFRKYDSLDDTIKNTELYVYLVSATLLVSSIYQFIVPFVKKLVFVIKPLSNKLLHQILIPDFKAKLGSREEVKHSLDKLIKIWLKKDENIVLIVDELDRCSEKTIVEFFSALQLFISSESIIKVISMNEELVALALANNNQFFLKDQATRDDKLSFGHDYLQKYISIPVYLNEHSDYSTFLEKLLKQTNFFDSEEKVTIISIINDITKIKDITPREVKRILNLLVLSKESVISHFEAMKHKVTFNEYIRWFFVFYFNPDESNFFVASMKKVKNQKKYKYMRFESMYGSFMSSVKEDSHKRIRYLNKYVSDMRIEVIVAADSLIDKSLIR